MIKPGLGLIVIQILLLSSGSLAQTVLINDEFDYGDSLWNKHWIDTSRAVFTASIDTSGKLSGKNSYLVDITKRFKQAI